MRRPGVLRAWLTAYAAATSTTATYQRILDAATPGLSEKPARSAVTAYRDVLDQLWMLDPVEAWLPGRNHLARLARAPKHQLADPGLAAHLLGTDQAALLGNGDGPLPDLRDGTLLGSLFEHLVTLDVQVYAERSESRVRHLRTADGTHEVDIVVERPDGRVLAIEVKLASSVTDHDVRHLAWLRERIGDDLVDAVVVRQDHMLTADATGSPWCRPRCSAPEAPAHRVDRQVRPEPFISPGGRSRPHVGWVVGSWQPSRAVESPGSTTPQQPADGSLPRTKVLTPGSME